MRCAGLSPSLPHTVVLLRLDLPSPAQWLGHAPNKVGGRDWLCQLIEPQRQLKTAQTTSSSSVQCLGRSVLASRPILTGEIRAASLALSNAAGTLQTPPLQASRISNSLTLLRRTKDDYAQRKRPIPPSLSSSLLVVSSHRFCRPSKLSRTSVLGLRHQPRGRTRTIDRLTTHATGKFSRNECAPLDESCFGGSKLQVSSRHQGTSKPNLLQPPSTEFQRRQSRRC